MSRGLVPAFRHRPRRIRWAKPPRMKRRAGEQKGWGVLWRSLSRLDGKVEYLLWEGPLRPIVFASRSAARAYIKARYGYIHQRPDLKSEPHGWRMPLAVPIRLSLRSIP